jgi:SNF2 family DNA or RNA helicase
MRLCLSGTPMENHLGELKNIFDFLVPGYLGSDEYFRKHYLVPIEQHLSVQAEQNLQTMIKPLKLRRTKNNVLTELPAKLEELKYCFLSPEQAKLYRHMIQERAFPLLKQLKDGSERISYLHVFAVLQLLKQICNHPASVLPDADYRKHQSGKFELFKELLGEALDSGNKVVVFSQYLKMIEIINQYCQHQGIQCIAMTGTSKNRGQLIDKFQTDPECKVFISSLLTGGIGIDLTAASTVIHYDRWWNASKEDQASDRVHRIGQKKFVQILKLVTTGTLEEKIAKMIVEKQKLVEKFLGHDSTANSTFSREELILLLQP